jgi:membrane protein
MIRNAEAMISRRSLGSRLRSGFFRIPGLRIFLLAMKGYIVHQSANQAGSVAFSTILAMFPLLILVSAAAGFMGKPGDAAALAAQVVGYAPPVVQEALQPVVDQVLSQRNQALLAIGTSSSRYGPLLPASRRSAPH